MKPAGSINAEAALHAAYEEWARLARGEGEAIAARDWARVADCQRRLGQLQPRIIRLTQGAREEWKQTNADLEVKRGTLRRIITGLMELELQNSTLLTAKKEIARKELGQLELARQNLKRIQRSYVPPRSGAWNSFS